MLTIMTNYYYLVLGKFLREQLIITEKDLNCLTIVYVFFTINIFEIVI